MKLVDRSRLGRLPGWPIAPLLVVLGLVVVALLVSLTGGSGRSAASAPAAVPTGVERFRESGTVIKVLDGDTFDIKEGSGHVQRVRVIGIQAPEVQWCGGSAATAALKRILPKGTLVRLASRKAASGNAPKGVWRVKRTVFKQVNGKWSDIAPQLVSAGLVFPFPFIGETTHNAQYLALAENAARARIGLYDPNRCGASDQPRERLKLEVVTGAPGRDYGPNSEFVLVFNGSDHDVSLAGWMVQDTSPLNAYFFPAGAVVRANDYVVVFSGNGTRGVAPGGRRDSRVFYSRIGHMWNDNVTEIAFLFDNAGGAQTGNLRDWLVLGS
jgi:endonuclease YncB( thermonuclease family)